MRRFSHDARGGRERETWREGSGAGGKQRHRRRRIEQTVTWGLGIWGLGLCGSRRSPGPGLGGREAASAGSRSGLRLGGSRSHIVRGQPGKEFAEDVYTAGYPAPCYKEAAR